MESCTDKTSRGSNVTDADVHQIKNWLHEVLGRNVTFETDDKTVAALKVLMRIQEVAKKEALAEYPDSEEMSRTSVAKAEKLESGLEAGNIPPGKLPKDTFTALEALAKAGAALGCQDGCPKRMEESAVCLEKKHKSLLQDKRQLKKDVAAFEQFIDMTTQQLLRASVQDKWTTPEVERKELDTIKKMKQRNREKLEKMQVRDSIVPDLLDPASLVAKSQELERLVVEKKKLEDKLEPMQDLPPDVEVMRARVATVKKAIATLNDTLDKKLQKDQAQNRGAGEV